jgi:hypothetical protein
MMSVKKSLRPLRTLTNYDLVAPETTDPNPPPSFEDPDYDLVATSGDAGAAEGAGGAAAEGAGAATAEGAGGAVAEGAGAATAPRPKAQEEL